MADAENDRSPKSQGARETQEALEKQVAQMKREINKLNRALAERVDDVVEEASGWYDTATDRASRATRQLKTQAQSVSETVQQNPGTFGSSFVLGALVGALLGSLLSVRHERDSRWY